MPLPADGLLGFAVAGAVAAALAFFILGRPLSPPTSRLGGKPLRASRRTFVMALLGAFVLSLTLHTPFRTTYPATNDEGSILLDILITKQGLWPFRDAGGAKGPLALLLLAPVALSADDPLAAARLLVSVLAGVEAVLLGILARRLWGDGAGILAAFLYAGTPAVIAQTTHVFLQPFALPFATGALILLAQFPTPSPSQGFLWLRAAPAIAGVLFGLAFLARFTALAFLPIGLLLITTWGGPSWRSRVRSAVSVAGGFAACVGIAAALAAPFLDAAKTLDALGWQGIVVGQQRAAHGQASRGLTILLAAAAVASLQGTLKLATALLRGALPLLVLAAAFLASRLGDLLRLPRIVPSAALLVLAAATPALLAPADLAPVLPATRGPLIWGTALLLLAAARLTALRQRSEPRQALRDLVMVGGGVLFLAIGYANYGRFRQHYHAEFLVLYVLAAAAVLAEALSSGGKQSAGDAGWVATQPRTNGEGPLPVLPIDRGVSPATAGWGVPIRGRTRGLLAFLLFATTGALLGFAYPNALRHPHAGNIPLDVVRTVTEDLKRRTSPGDEVFTAQVLFPAVAGRPVPFGITHPGWYREEALGILPTAIRERYYPDRDALRRYLEEKPVRTVVVERRTREVFLEFDSALKDLLRTQYRRARVIENPLLDSVEIWERATP